MKKFTSGIKELDTLVDSLYAGDNVVWEVEAGTSSELFVQHFIEESLAEHQNVIYVSFNKSPQSILQQIGDVFFNEHFTLLDCFTSGKGKDDKAFTRFYDQYTDSSVIRVNKPADISSFTLSLTAVEDKLSPGTRYIFESLTGMQDLWGDEQSTYKFFTYQCPRLYDLGTVAYWILERDAHSQTFKANLHHITQVVLELYKRKDRLFIKALKMEGRQSREAFKPHSYEIVGKEISIRLLRREPPLDIGVRIREIRTRIGMSQKELAEKVGLTPSFISQLENNQISPSLNSFIQICNALGVSLTEVLEGKKLGEVPWLIKREKIVSNLSIDENGLKSYRIVRNGTVLGILIVLEPHSQTERHLIPAEGRKLLYVVKGNVFVVINNRGETLRSGDVIYLEDEFPSLWKNEGGDTAELFLVCLKEWA